MFVGIVKLSLHFPFCHSLKEKRRHLQKIKSKLLNTHSLVAAEVEFQDTWQRSSLGFALVSSDRRILESILDKAVNHIVEMGLGEVLDCQKEIGAY